MVHNILNDKATKLFMIISAFFVANALIAESIGVKIFSLEKIFGAQPANFTLFGESGLGFNLTCGVLLWPLQFVVTDILNEYYGPKAVRRISYTAVALIAYAFLMYYMAIEVPPADFWRPMNSQHGIAETPSVMIRSLKKGTLITLSAGVAAGFFNSIHLKKTNSRKAMLQINVNFDKKLKTRITQEVSY